MTIIKKIKFKFKEIVVSQLIKIGLFFSWPQLTAVAFWLASNKVNPECKSQNTVLCMGRSVFADDLDTMANYSGRIKYVVIWRTYFGRIFHYFIRGSEGEKVTEANYHTYDFCKQGKQNYYLFLNKMFPLLHKFIGFNAVMCCNIGYLDQQEFEKVCMEKKVPYIVLQKEGLITSGTESRWADEYVLRKFRGTKILYYNEGIMNELIKRRFSNMTKNQFKVVGMPRLDNYFTLSKHNKSLKKQVLFFSFYPQEKFVCQIDDEEKLKQAYRRADDFHRWVFNFAVKHPDIKVVVKLKTAPHYTEYIKKIFNDNFRGNIKNLEIINVGQVFDLIKNSTAVVTFLSTTCLMAIAAGKTLITPYFGDLITDREWDYFVSYPEFVNYAKTEDDLEKYILNSDKDLVHDLDNKNEFLEKFLGNSDGRASSRAEESIIETIKQFK